MYTKETEFEQQSNKLLYITKINSKAKMTACKDGAFLQSHKTIFLRLL